MYLQETPMVAEWFCVFTVMAAAAIANIVKSSLGPVGLDKMLVDDIGVCVILLNERIHAEMILVAD